MENEITSQEIFLQVRSVATHIRSKWLTILFFGLIGGIIGFTYATLQKTKYKGLLTFAFEDESTSNGAIGGLASQFGFDVGGNAGGAFSENNLMELMKSRSLVEQTLLTELKVDNKVTTLAEYFIEFTGLRKKLNRNAYEDVYFPPDADREKLTLRQNEILGNIYNTIINNNLDISQKDRKVSIMSVEVTSENELFSKFFAEKLAKVVSEFYVNTKSKKALLNVNILQRQVDSVRNILNHNITSVAVANDNTFNLNPALNINKAPSTERQIDVQTNTAILSQLVVNLELAKIALRKETPLIQVVDTPVLPLKMEHISKIKSMVVAGMLFSCLVTFFLIAKKWFVSLVKKAKL